MNSIQTIQRLAVIARQLAENADVGGMETAGTLISTLAEHPDDIEDFLSGKLSFETIIKLNKAQNGCLNWHSPKNNDLLIDVNEHRKALKLPVKESFKIDHI